MRGESCSSPSSSSPLNSSTSHLYSATLLIRFAGGEAIWDGSARNGSTRGADVGAGATGAGGGDVGARVVTRASLSTALTAGGGILTLTESEAVAVSVVARSRQWGLLAAGAMIDKEVDER